MSIQRAEQLKRELTDKFVVVTEGVPELRRFSGLTGQVKTVNMSCRALVQFDGPADIGWYDIDPTYLKLVNAPAPKKSAAQAAPAKTPGEVQGSAPKPVGKSPLELARAQGAQKTEAPKPAAATVAPATEGKKLSPLELARQQGAPKAGGAATPAAPPAPAAAAPAAAPAAGGKKLSPLELARQQGAVKAGGTAPAAAPPAAKPAAAPAPAPAPEPPTPAPAAPAPKAAAPAPVATKVDASKMSTAEILAACRQQGAFKG